jgi:alanine dehydrogenase
VRVLTDQDVARLLDMPSCIRAIEHAFRARGDGRHAPSGMAGIPLEGGSLHAKIASLEMSRPYAAAKINANLPRNPAERQLPTIQGVLVLFDAATGTPLAVMDSGTLTALRTAAASAVAASHLALPHASTVAFVGCGVQARAHLAALREVRSIDRVFALDQSPTAARAFSEYSIAEHGISCATKPTLRDATRQSQIIVTSTPSHRALLFLDDVEPGSFVAAVGADNEHKQEIDPALLASAAVVVDDLEQCSRIGDLHHALAACVMQPADVRGSLDQIVAGKRPGRMGADEIIIFDSTGLAIEDVAAAAVAYERACAEGTGVVVTPGVSSSSAP